MRKKSGFRAGYTRLASLPGRQKFAAFDLETQGLGGKVLYSTYCLEGGNPQGIGGKHLTPADIIAVQCDAFEEYPEYLWYAHNAQYDWRYFFDEFDLREYRYELMMRTDSDIFGVKIETQDGKSFTLLDSLAFWPGTLKDLLKSFAPNLPKLEIDIENFDPQNPGHIAYALRDSEGLVTALVNLDAKLAHVYNVRIGMTTAGTAVKAWRHTLKREERYFNDEKNEDYIRTAYYGGLVFLTRTDTVFAAETYDINSSYPFNMREFGVPYGRAVHRRTIDYTCPGIYRVVVETPENMIVPILPKRVVKGASRKVLWPSGRFETCVTVDEIEFAVKHGYKLLKVYDGIAWPGKIFPFKNFVDKAEKLRNEFRGQPEEVLAKLMQNSLYGKFGSRRERRKIFRPYTEEEKLDAFPWGDGSRFWYKVEHADDMLCLPQWAVYITAHARLYLLKHIYEVIGPENVVYGDTDSITVLANGDKLPGGKAYGAFKLEKTWEEFRAIAPKVYVGTVEGKYKGAIKGIPKRQLPEEIWQQLSVEGMIEREITTLPRLTQYLKGNTETTHMRRKSTDINNSQNWRTHGNFIKPREIYEDWHDIPTKRQIVILSSRKIA